VYHVQGAVLLFFWLIAIVAFIVEVFALIDAIRVPTDAYTAASKQTKKLWLIILGIANVVGLGAATLPDRLPLLSILPIVAFIVAAIYLADVRPAVATYRGKGGSRGGGSNMGPYGPW
jgi:phage-related minor tail protein